MKTENSKQYAYILFIKQLPYFFLKNIKETNVLEKYYFEGVFIEIYNY